MSEATPKPALAARVASPREAHPRIARPNGLWGMWLLAATEAALFGSLIASYFYLQSRAPVWPPPGIKAPDVLLPLVLTAALVGTSLPMLLAARAARRGATRPAWWLIATALLVQGSYIAVQALLFKHDLNSFSPRDTSYGSVYFTLLGVHHAHVVVGILLNLSLLARLLGGLNEYRVVGVRAVALYWCFVNVAAVLVVLTQISPALL